MKPSHVLTAILALPILSGCAPQIIVKPTPTPSGQQGFYIECDRFGAEWPDCHKKAADLCKGPYTVLDKTDTSTPTPYGPMTRRSLMVECKQP